MTNRKYYLPAEWESQEAVQLTWPHKDTDWAPYLEEITDTFVELCDVITRYERLVVATQVPELTMQELRARLSKEQLMRVQLVECMTDDTWARDHGPITLCSSSRGGDAQYLSFRFNGWGEKFKADNDNRIPEHILQMVKHTCWGGVQACVDYVSHDDFVLEGGSIESDGRGMVMTTSQCLMAPHRNQPLTQQEVEEQLKQRLHAERIIWLNHGNLVGDDTDGHIDTIVRVCPDDTLLYVKCDDETDEQYEDFCLLEEELKTLRTESGAPFRLLPLPMPRECRYDDERLPATYANFLVVNGAVIVPTYNQPDLDRVACEQVAKAFPGRDIIPVDSRVIIRQHGSIHCLTMQIPQL